MVKDRWPLNNPDDFPSVAGPREDRPDIWASEVGDFAYCARGWWLRRVAGVITLERTVRILAAAVGIIAVGVLVLLLTHLVT